MIPQLQVPALLPGTFAAGLTGDLVVVCAGTALATRRATGGLTLELLAASSSSEVILISGPEVHVGPGQYRVWGDDCESGGVGPAPGEIVFRINAQGGTPQWTLSAYEGLLLIESDSGGLLAGRFEARSCAERIGSDAELAVTVHGFFQAFQV